MLRLNSHPEWSPHLVLDQRSPRQSTDRSSSNFRHGHVGDVGCCEQLVVYTVLSFSRRTQRSVGNTSFLRIEQCCSDLRNRVQPNAVTGHIGVGAQSSMHVYRTVGQWARRMYLRRRRLTDSTAGAVLVALIGAALTVHLSHIEGDVLHGGCLSSVTPGIMISPRRFP